METPTLGKNPKAYERDTSKTGRNLNGKTTKAINTKQCKPNHITQPTHETYNYQKIYD